MDNKKLLSGIIFGLVFLLSVVFFNYIFVGRNSRAVAETSEASLPILSIQVGENHINNMHGYTGSMDKNLLRDSIVPLETSYRFDVIISEVTEGISSVSYTIYETDNETVRESGIASFQRSDKTTKAAVTLKKKLQRGKVYLMELTIENEKGVEVHYYTRLKYGTELHFTECMDFIQKFHEAALAGDTEGEQYVTQFIEPNASYQNNNLSKVDIQSNSDVICYAGMKPVVEKSYPPMVKEITEDLSSVEMRSILSYENSKGEKRYFMVTEYYKVRYSVSRMYLLGYERTQEEYFQYDAVDGGKNRFLIGTTGGSDKDLHTQNDCEMAAFVQQDQLWFYDFQQDEMVQVFSFIGEDYRDVRNNYDQNQIDILNMDKNGDMIFVVYGYMNRGVHEGENGICVYRFDYKERVNEEVMFIPTEVPYENMKEALSKLAYLNKEDVFYFYLDGSIYKVDASDKDYEVLQTNVEADTIVSSEKGYLAVSDGDSITITNMENEKQQTITCGDKEQICGIGFIETDFIYGIANKSDVQKKSDGSMTIPMKEIKIVDKDLKEIKNYKKSGVYILSASTEGNVVKMTRATRQGGKYKKLVDDYIHYKEDKSEKIIFEYSYDSNLYNQLYMTLPTYVYVTDEPKLTNTQEKVSGNYKTIDFASNESRQKECYVYAKGTLQGTYTSVKEAIDAAKNGAGVVVNSKQNYIWEKGVAKEYAKVPNVSIVKAKNKEESFAACMKMLLKLNADNTSYETLVKEEGEPMDILSKYFKERAVNLSGCSLEDVVYYISEGRPFIAKRANGTYIVVMSYNSTKLRYIDPVKGESIQGERKALEKEFKKGGNEFYSYTE